MIDPHHPIIRRLCDAGYRIAGHCYLQPDGSVKYTYVAKNQAAGLLLQGWSAGGSAEDALSDLARRVGMDPHE